MSGWCLVEAATSFLIPVSYVVLIHVFDNGAEGLHHPTSCKKRFLAAACNNILAISSTYFLLCRKYVSPFEKMGFNGAGWLYASLFPIVLTTLPYFGNIAALLFERNRRGPISWSFLQTKSQLMWLKYVIVGPISEEIAFRGCAAILMNDCFGRTAATFLCPLFFAICHLHHIFDDLKNGCSWSEALAQRTFQMLYTYLFGIYATVIFFATGQIISPILSHIVCNMFGLPNIFEIDCIERSKRRPLLMWNVAGFLLWLAAFYPLTSPTLYAAV